MSAEETLDLTGAPRQTERLVRDGLEEGSSLSKFRKNYKLHGLSFSGPTFMHSICTCFNRSCAKCRYIHVYHSGPSVFMSPRRVPSSLKVYAALAVCSITFKTSAVEICCENWLLCLLKDLPGSTARLYTPCCKLP